jgi:hypothetical protein
MSDESGGDFGGGSVKWRITTGNESQDPSDKVRDKSETVEGVPKNVNAGRDKDNGIDDSFLIRLRVPNGDRNAVKASLEAAAAALTNENQVEITVPRRQSPKQIQVIWRRHQPGLRARAGTRVVSTKTKRPRTRAKKRR